MKNNFITVQGMWLNLKNKKWIFIAQNYNNDTLVNKLVCKSKKAFKRRIREYSSYLQDGTEVSWIDRKSKQTTVSIINKNDYINFK